MFIGKNDLVFTGESNSLRPVFINALLGGPFLPPRTDDSTLAPICITFTAEIESALLGFYSIGESDIVPVDSWQDIPDDSDSIDFISLTVFCPEKADQGIIFWDLPSDSSVLDSQKSALRRFFTEALNIRPKIFCFTKSEIMPADDFLCEVYGVLADSFTFVLEVPEGESDRSDWVYSAFKTLESVNIFTAIRVISFPRLEAFYEGSIDAANITALARDDSERLSYKAYISSLKERIIGAELFSEIDGLADNSPAPGSVDLLSRETFLYFSEKENPAVLTSIGKSLLASGKAEEAKEKFLCAAKKKHPEACLELAKLLFSEKPAPEETKSLFDWLEIAADAGIPEAQGLYGRVFELDRWSRYPVSRINALFWLKLGCENKDPYARYIMANLLHAVRESEEDNFTIVNYFIYAFVHGIFDAGAKFAEIILDGDMPEFDSETALLLLDEAITAGSKEALGVLADYYITGEGKGQDDDQAFELASRAAACDLPAGYLHLGRCFLEGIGCDADVKSAVEAFKKGIAKNELECNYAYAMILIDGENGSQDSKTALEILDPAVQAGMQDAKYLCGITLYNGNGIETNEEEGLRLITSSAKSGYEPACDFLEKNGFSMQDPAADDYSEEEW